MRKICTLGLMRRDWKPIYGSASEALSVETERHGQAEPTKHGASPRPYNFIRLTGGHRIRMWKCVFPTVPSNYLGLVTSADKSRGCGPS